jgi:hypothetical protein
MKKKFGVLSLVLVLALGALGVSYAGWIDSVWVNGTVSTGDVCMEFDGDCFTSDPFPPTSLGFPPDLELPVIPDLSPPFPFPDKNAGMNFENPAPYSTDKNVAWAFCFFEEVGEGEVVQRVDLSFYNAYPFYYAASDWNMCNCGNIPVKLNAIIVEVPGQAPVYWDPDSEDILTLDLNDNGTPDFQMRWDEDAIGSLGVQLEPDDCWDMSMSYLVLQDTEGFEDGSFNFSITFQWIQWNSFPEVINGPG